ncbi:hypothetical protein ATZ36_05270 [Candidatus Endomicrobiellum trichonymphae]|uniref:Uncharacterized protein n=1 Tax=Endomicrobium trichonymphae TaxID=1408204 RepID=A0A1E5IIL7_ENDTX|nr:hypothetical protein ATZ36_05270 [Candidatus Endomicrobium trichonymphae]
MKKVILSVLMLLLFQTNLFSASEITDGWYNGNFWVSRNHTSHLDFLEGFSDGEDSIYYDLYSQVEFQKTKDLMEKTFNEKYTSKGTTYGAIIDFLNKFYSTSQYRIIPINKALEWFFLSTNGKITVKEIDDRATGMLKLYAENPPTMTDIS